MSQEDESVPVTESTAELTGKAKKAARSAERHKKGKKEKSSKTTTDNDDATTAAAPESNAVADQIAALGAENTSGKSSKKRKRAAEAEDDNTAPSVSAPAADASTTPAEATAPADGEKKKKKRRKKNKSTTTPTNTTSTEGAEGDATTATKNQRFIVFIGNLPFTATTEQITSHFASIKPASVRHISDPATKKSKGFAFLEFDNYDRMKTCLKLFHHSEFDSGVGGEKGKRKINVELTAGGGGKSDNRKEKLKEKNTRLEEQRVRRREAEEKAEARKAKKGGDKGGKEDVHEEKAPGKVEPDSGIHPARLAMLGRQ